MFTFPHKGDAPHYQLSISPIATAAGPGAGQPVAAGYIFCLRNVSDFKKLDEVKSTFLATISHGLKTPLASIKLSLMLLQDPRTTRPGTLPVVHGDVEKTTWVLINLLSNAIRYLPAGAPLCIRAEPWGEMVRVSVEDCGPGIPAEHHWRIFERFAGMPGTAAARGWA